MANDRIKNNPKIVVVHCAATPDYEIGDPKFDLFGADDIDSWHRVEPHNFSKIGYHWVIRRTGEIEPGRPETEIGAHCHRKNAHSLGVCYIGTRNPTRMQIASFLELFDEIHDHWGIPPANWYGHYEFVKYKECPCLNMELFRALLREHLKRGFYDGLSRSVHTAPPL